MSMCLSITNKYRYRLYRIVIELNSLIHALVGKNDKHIFRFMTKRENYLLHFLVIILYQ